MKIWAGAMAIAFLLGGTVVWVSEFAQRRRARRAEQAVRLLEAQVQELNEASKLSPPEQTKLHDGKIDVNLPVNSLAMLEVAK